jgi:Rrf2 family protein
MKVSTKGRYGLRVMMELASCFGQGPVQAGTIADKQDISGNYIHILLGGLKAAQLVRAVRGASGGYELTRDPRKITVLDVVQALEGHGWPVACVDHGEGCPRSKTCAARDVWGELADAMEKVLSGISLEQLVKRQRAKSDKEMMFHI